VRAPGNNPSIEAAAAWLPPEIKIREQFGWRRHTRDGLAIWTKGWGGGADPATLAAWCRQWTSAPSADTAGTWLAGLDGNFAFVIAHADWVLAAVDRVRSIPVAWSEQGSGLIDDQAARLLQRTGDRVVDTDASLALGMAGYTIDVATLYPAVKQLCPGELVLFARGAAPVRHRYYTYAPWRADKPDFDHRKASGQLADLTLRIVDVMMKSIGPRDLIVPLSAGRDSRLIVSAAHHLGYRNIRTFSYGRPGNHESDVSRAIAERLNFPWRFVPMNVGFMRRHYESHAYRDYLAFADTLQAVPFVQDLPQLMQLKDEGYVPADAVIANGNSGDYISGAHVIPAIQEVPHNLNVEQRKARVIKALYNKHFGLWDALRTSDHEARIARQLETSIARAGASFADPKDDFGVYEYAEFQDRQCKYVIGGQRIYEFLGHEWRLPLWDNGYLDFFEKVPLEGKIDQRLYAEMLQSENWGGVWRDVAVNRKTIRPHWIRPLRQLARVAHGPLGRDAWHRFEKRYFRYWMENGSHSAIRRYREVARDDRVARHGIAWLTEDYLRRRGLDFAGVSVSSSA
jgi:asparagine synthase (glutamine-hydrolysing)